MESIDTHDKIFNILYSSQDEIMWQSILVELVTNQNMDPWNVDVSLLTQKYIEKVRELTDHDFRISGKVLLAAAILLKIKSERLVGSDFEEFDKLLASLQEPQDDLLPFEEPANSLRLDPKEIPPLLPRTPQPRTRKVSIFDLVKALQQALEVKNRRVLRSEPLLHFELPHKQRDITELIKEIYGKVKNHIKCGNNHMAFSQLAPSGTWKDRVATFVPLLHLSQQHKIELTQEQPFGDIKILLKAKI